MHQIYTIIMSTSPLSNVFSARRSIRKYTSQNIDDELLNELLEASFRSSNTGNMQLYSVVVTRDKEMKRKLAPLHFNQPMIMQAPVVLTFCADCNRFIKWCRQRNADPGFDNFQSFFTASIDAVIAAQTFCMAAESKGLGICYIGTVTYLTQPIIDVLKLPKYVVPVATVTVGYPEIIPSQPERLPLDAIIHRETYHDYQPEDIDRLYFEKENSEANKNYVKENNKETLAQVFTDVRYTRKNNETFSESFLEAIKKQGF